MPLIWSLIPEDPRWISGIDAQCGNPGNYLLRAFHVRGFIFVFFLAINSIIILNTGEAIRMPDIIVCYKWVVDSADIKVAPESGELILDRVGYRISDYDRNAIEEAVRLQEKYGGTVTAITVGGPAAKKSLKDVLARGPEKACFVWDPNFEDLEPSQTAAILASAIRSTLKYDLIVCGEGSGDLYAQQVGPRLAESLGIPCAAFVNKVVSLEGGRVIVERKVEEGIEVVAMPLPALITVLPEINTPRVPGLKDTLAAGKKPVIEIKGAELGQFSPCLETLRLLGTKMSRQGEKFGAEPAEISRLVSVLVKEGVIS